MAVEPKTLKGQVITLDPSEYFELRLLMSDVDRVIAQTQLAVNEAVVKRDMLLATLRAKHPIPETITAVQYDDDTHRFSFD